MARSCCAALAQAHEKICLHRSTGKDEGRTKSKKSADTPSRSESSGTSGDSERDMYEHKKVIGNGSFGVVFQAHHKKTGEVVAVKKVLQDRRFKVRDPRGF
eukprot:SAG31_NODE_4_length_45662_cov_15.654622_12_plen_101_part_00